MKSIITKVSKTSLIKATLMAVVAAYASNTAFNFSGALVFSDFLVNTANNVIDVAQLVSFVAIRFARFGKLNKFDSPFIIGGIVAIFS